MDFGRVVCRIGTPESLAVQLLQNRQSSVIMCIGHRGCPFSPQSILIHRGLRESVVVWIDRFENLKPFSGDTPLLELDFPHNGPFPRKYDPKQYIAILEKYLALVPYLLPKDDLDPLNQPTLRHPGLLKFYIALPTFISCSFSNRSKPLNPNNISISPKTGAISCIIDWQHTTIEPRLLVAGYPRAFENPEINEPFDLDALKLPSEYDSLSVGEKQKPMSFIVGRYYFTTIVPSMAYSTSLILVLYVTLFYILANASRQGRSSVERKFDHTDGDPRPND